VFQDNWIIDESKAPPNKFAGNKDVKTVTQAEFDELLKTDLPIVADVSFRYCDKCAVAQDKFISIAHTMEGKAHFVHINALKDRALARNANPKCDRDHCNFYVVKPNDPWNHFDAGPHTEEKLHDLIQMYLDPLVTMFDNEEETQNFKTAHGRTVVGSFALKGSAAFNTFTEYARTLLESGVRFGAMIEPGAEASTVTMTNAQGVEISHPFLQEEQDNMTMFLLAHTMPLMQNYSWEGKQDLEAVSIPVVHVWYDDKDVNFWKTTAPKISEAATVLRGKAQFVLNKKQSESYKMADFGLEKSTLNTPPMLAIGIAQAASEEKFAYEPESPEAFLEDGFWTGKAVAFVEEVLNNRVVPSYKSEPLPASETPPGNTAKLVWKHLVGGGAAKEDQLVLVCKSFTSGIDKARTSIARISRAVKAVEGIRVFEYNYEDNHVDETIFAGVKADNSDLYVFFRAADKTKASQYKGKLKQADILKFLKKKSKAAKKGWSTIKTELQLVKEELAAKKKAEEEAAVKKKEEEEARKAKEAEVKKKLDDAKAAKAAATAEASGISDTDKEEL
jgi:hypothetical protein